MWRQGKRVAAQEQVAHRPGKLTVVRTGARRDTGYSAHSSSSPDGSSVTRPAATQPSPRSRSSAPRAVAWSVANPSICSRSNKARIRAAPGIILEIITQMGRLGLH